MLSPMQLAERSVQGCIDTFLTSNDKSSKQLRDRLADFWRKMIQNAPRESVCNLQANPFCNWLFAFST